MEIVCLQHVKFEGPGSFQNWLAGKGVDLRCVLVPEEELPPVESCQAVIVMGGPMNIYQHRDHPWLAREKEFIRTCLDHGVPLIGICLGAQLIADALGAWVFQNMEREIGWFPVKLSPEVTESFPGMKREMQVLHWHGDTFGLPAGTIRVAGSEACGEQGFWIPGKCLGLQFHPEATRESLEALIENCGDELTEGRFVQDREMLKSGGYDHDFGEWEPLLMDVLDRAGADTGAPLLQ
ncbi:MAG: gamma-glutamyl-gamma-aminobutyrate hydrolase family protein [Luteolibacter sp.]